MQCPNLWFTSTPKGGGHITIVQLQRISSRCWWQRWYDTNVVVHQHSVTEFAESLRPGNGQGFCFFRLSHNNADVSRSLELIDHIYIELLFCLHKSQA